MTFVKICGITNLEDALICAGSGADAIGFNFYSKSPRFVAPETVRVIVEQLPVNILKVGVFVDASRELIEDAVQKSGLGAVQLHGNETPEFAKTLQEDVKRPVVKAFRVSNNFKAEDVLRFSVDAILLDAYSPKMYGGTGETFDWEIATQVRGIFPKMYLAGGLTPDNLGRAIAQVNPFAVDVSSSVESSPGKKDPELLRRFIAEAKHND